MFWKILNKILFGYFFDIHNKYCQKLGHLPTYVKIYSSGFCSSYMYHYYYNSSNKTFFIRGEYRAWCYEGIIPDKILDENDYYTILKWLVENYTPDVVLPKKLPKRNESGQFSRKENIC